MGSSCVTQKAERPAATGPCAPAEAEASSGLSGLSQGCPAALPPVADKESNHSTAGSQGRQSRQEMPEDLQTRPKIQQLCRHHPEPRPGAALSLARGVTPLMLRVTSTRGPRNPQTLGPTPRWWKTAAGVYAYSLGQAVEPLPLSPQATRLGVKVSQADVGDRCVCSTSAGPACMAAPRALL